MNLPILGPLFGIGMSFMNFGGLPVVKTSKSGSVGGATVCLTFSYDLSASST